MEPVNPLLPALRPATSGLLRRAGGLLGAVRGIQQEASAEWWYERGMEHKLAERWSEASSCFDKALRIDKTHRLAWLYSAVANLQLGNQCKFYSCITNAHLLAFSTETDDWMCHVLNEEDIKNIYLEAVVNSPGLGLLLHSVGDIFSDGFEFSFLKSESQANCMIDHILAYELVLRAVHIFSGNPGEWFYKIYGDRAWQQSMSNDDYITGQGQFGCQPCMLVALINRILELL